MSAVDPEMLEHLRKVAYRNRISTQWLPGFEVPREIEKAWKGPDFTKSYLRSFMTFCMRTRICEWLRRINHCLERKRDPWQKNEPAAKKLTKALEDWGQGQWVRDQWGHAQTNISGQASEMPEDLRKRECLRIAREAIARSTREAIRQKGRADR